MSTTCGVVRARDGHFALVEVERGGCGRCNEPGGCGGANKAGLFGIDRQFRVDNTFGADVGERVDIEIEDGVIRASATRAYVVPLLFVVIGAVCGRVVGDVTLGESAAIAGAALGLGTAWIWLRFRNHAATGLAVPRIVARS